MGRAGPAGRLAVGLAVAVAALSVAGCRGYNATPAKREPQIIWRSVGSWSGTGNRQTESFTSDTGALRVRWETTAKPSAPPDSLFRLTAHSAISGRPLEQVVEFHGVGTGTGYVSQDPHVFYMLVESSGLNWQFTVEEGIAGEVIRGDSRR
jgi:hypothetical protein